MDPKLGFDRAASERLIDRLAPVFIQARSERDEVRTFSDNLLLQYRVLREIQAADDGLEAWLGAQ